MIGSIAVTQLGKGYRQYPTRWSRMLEWLVPFSRPRHHLRWVLQNLSFNVQPGEAIGIIGVNGAGKSTLLKLITGTIQPTTGHVQMVGHVAALLELGIGFHPDFTGRQNVLMAGQLLGFHANRIIELMPEIEEFSGIGEYIDQPVRVYSSGMLVRLAFAVATTVRPDILIVDEALSVGDAYFQHKCFARIRKYQSAGTTLLFVSHDLAALRALCTRTVWLEKGLVRAIGETKEVLEAYTTELYAKEQGLELPNAQDEPCDCVVVESKLTKRDCRQDFVNNSCIRNDIQVFDFVPSEPGWGTGHATITNTYLRSIDGTSVSWIVGGEEVQLIIEAKALQQITNVIVGFIVRDRLGQNLFGDNTYLATIDRPISVPKGSAFRGAFTFLMPPLPQGVYAIAAAIVSGTHQDHLVHEWVNDAMFVESHNGTGANGLIGVPIHKIVVEHL